MSSALGLVEEETVAAEEEIITEPETQPAPRIEVDEPIIAGTEIKVVAVIEPIPALDQAAAPPVMTQPDDDVGSNLYYSLLYIAVNAQLFLFLSLDFHLCCFRS